MDFSEHDNKNRFIVFSRALRSTHYLKICYKGRVKFPPICFGNKSPPLLFFLGNHVSPFPFYLGNMYPPTYSPYVTVSARAYVSIARIGGQFICHIVAVI